MPELRNLIRVVLKLPDGAVRDARYNGEVVAGESFITVNDIPNESLGTRVDFIDGKEVIKESKQTLISINAYGKNANALLSKFRLLISSSAFQSGLRRLKLCVLRASDIRDLTATIGATKEERSQLDLFILHTHIVSTELDSIERVDIHAQAQSNPNDIINILTEVNNK